MTVDVLSQTSLKEEIKESLSRYKYKTVCRLKGSLDAQLGDTDFTKAQMECTEYDENWNPVDSLKSEIIVSKEGIIFSTASNSKMNALSLLNYLMKK